MTNWLLPVLILSGAHLIGEFGKFGINTVADKLFADLKIGGTCKDFLNKTVDYNRTTCVEKNLTYIYDSTGAEFTFLTQTVYTPVQYGAAVLFAFLSDSLSQPRRPLFLTLMFFVFGLALLMNTLAKNFSSLLVFRVIDACAYAGTIPISVAYISSIVPIEKKGTAMSIFQYGVYVGFGLVYYVGISSDSWKSVYLISGVGILCFTVLIFLVVKETSVEPQKDEEKEDDQMLENHKKPQYFVVLQYFWKHVFQNKKVLLLLLAAIVRSMAAVCYQSFMKAFLIKFLPEKILAVSMMIAPALGGILGVSFGGMITDLIIKKNCMQPIKARLLIMSISQIIAAFFAYGVIEKHDSSHFILLTIAFFFAEMWFGCLYATLMDILPEKERQYLTTFFGIFLFSMNFTASYTPYMKDILGLENSMKIMYAGGYAASGILFLLNFLIN